MIATAIRSAGIVSAGVVFTSPLAVSARGWYGVTRAAQLLGYSRRTVLRMIERGDLTAHHVGGGQWRISRALIDAIIEPSARALDVERAKAKARVIRRGSK